MSSGRDFLGPYQFLRMIRAGNTTTIWEAIKTGQTGKRYALKVLIDRFKKDRQELEQLRNEAIVGKSFDHEYVITIYEFEQKYELPYISMQLFNARNLKQELREKPDRLAYHLEEIVQKGAEGVLHMHLHGWIHCDVKPDNFLVDENANVKLIDFSIAQKAKSGIAAIFGGRKKLQGTRSYMAPEQIRGKRVTPATDVYGFGCVIFELLTGRPPFTGTTPDEVLSRHLRSSVPGVQAYNNRVSDKFAALLLRMLAKDPKKRPQTMADFIKEYKALNSRIYKAGMRPKLETGESTG